MPDIDLKELAIDRDSGTPGRLTGRPGRHLLSRYILPGVVVVGFVVLAGWLGWDLVFPPREVTVVQLLTNRVVATEAGHPVFEASGWIEPRPTSIRVAALAPGVIEKLMVVEDQLVKPGQAIASMVTVDRELATRRLPVAPAARAVANSPSSWARRWKAVGASTTGCGRTSPSKRTEVSTSPTSTKTRDRRNSSPQASLLALSVTSSPAPPA